MTLTEPKFLGFLRISVLSIILVAGLWPFRTPSNHVTWLSKEDGLDFGPHASILSSGAFRASLDSNASGSVEIWLRATQPRSGRAILSFDASAHPGIPFTLRQSKDALVIQRHNEDGNGISRVAWQQVNGVFREKEPILVTITLGPQDTTVYLDGALSGVFPILGASANNLTGRLVVANSPRASGSWSGQILGLAIYDRQLTPAQIARHHEGWIKNHRPPLAQDEAPIALYLFNEHRGDVVHNQLDPTTDLLIPKHYFVLHPAFLSSPLREYHASWSYWEDVGINIAGFIPFGFVFYAYFSRVPRAEHAAAITIAFGFAVSLTIEVLQAFLPTRDSGMTDLITNTLGATIGVMAFRHKVGQGLLAVVGFRGTKSNVSAVAG